MKEKEILNQLNNFQNLKADKVWKDKNREILLNQIFSGQNETERLGFFDSFKLQLQIVRNISQPAMAAFLICAFILSGGALSLRAARDTTPGDSFYIAKIISEKTQLALTFDEKEKLRLGIEFAGNRADEIAQVLKNDTAVENKQEKVKKLVDNFKKEIDIAKTRANKINSGTMPKEEAIVEDEGAMVFSANLGREENGMQISEEITEEPEAVLEPEIVAVAEIEVSTTTVEAKEEDSSPKTILDQATGFLEQDDYEAMLTKLEEAGVFIEQSNITEVEDGTGTEEKGEVLGVEEGAETASSTETTINN